MDNVDCDGSEPNLFQCTYSTEHNCGTGEGAGVRCEGTRMMDAPDNLDGGKDDPTGMKIDIQTAGDDE